ncbi:hypothetical protein [Streptosporangium sp. NPDC049644]
MNSRNDTEVVAGPASGRTSHTHRLRGLHLVPAAVTIPTLARSLRTRTD